MYRVPRALILLLGTLAPIASAHADDAVDCQRTNLNVRLPACSRIIAAPKTTNAAKAIALASRGSGYVSRGDREKAAADFTEAIRLDPTPPAVHGYRGRLHNVTREYDKAIEAFTEALRIAPNDHRVFNLRGGTYFNQRDFDRAIADYTAAITLSPNYATAHNNRANCYRDKGELDAAIAGYNDAIRIDPRYASAFNNRGIAHGRKGDRDAAFADFEAAIRLDPGLANAYYNRAVGSTIRGDQAKAFADYETAIRLNPNDALPYVNRGSIHINRGERDRAIADFDTAIRLGPTLALAYSNRGHALALKGETDRAIADYAKVLELPAPAAADKQRQVVARERIARLKQTQRVATPGAGQSPAKPKRVALVIGNSNYASVGLLANPTNDAKAFAASLRRLDFGAVIEVHDATREQMGTALKDFGDKADGAEWAVVFFAGHGLEVNGTTYLIPTDAALKRDTHVDDEALSLNRVQAKADAASKLGLVILDSCRNNPFLARMTRSGGAARAIGAGLAPIEPEGNVLVFYAAKHGTVAADGDGRHSPFTESLLAHIEEPGLEINFLLRKVRDDVRKKTDKRQEPFHYGSLGSDPIYFKAAKR